MTFEIGLLFGLLAVMVYFFLTEKLPVDLTAFLGLAFLVLTGYLGADQAFTGFASTAVITMLSIFILGGALLRTGVADVIGGWAYRLVGGREAALIVTLMLVAGGLSAFMNNIAAVAVLMPAVSSIAKRSRIAPSRLFMPLAFGAVLGGTTTLVGTPPNIVAGAMMAERGMEPFSLFEFTPIGLMLLAAGVLFMVTLGRRLLPERSKDPGLSEARELARTYQLQDRLFSVQIPPGSHLEGRRLEEAQLGPTLSMEILAIKRHGKSIHAPDRATKLQVGDELLVKGRRDYIEELARVKGVELQRTNARALPGLMRGVGGIRARVAEGSELVGKTLRESRFRDRYGLTVVGIVQAGELQIETLAVHPFSEGDEIIALGARAELERFAGVPGMESLELGFGALAPLEDRLFLIQIPEGSQVAGKTVGETYIGERAGLTVGGIVRDGVTRLGIAADERVQAGDQLVVAGEPWRLIGLLELGQAPLRDGVPDILAEGDETGVVEVAVAPRSSLAGMTLQQLRFRGRYGLQVLSIWSGGQPHRTNLTDRRLEFGDALLLQGRLEKIEQLVSDPDFVVLSQHVEESRRTSKAPYAVGALLLMITMVVAGYQPIHVAAFTAASLAVLGGALSMEEAYRVIEWRAIFLVAAVLPVGIAMEQTGAADLLAGGVMDVAGPLGPYAVLAALVVLSSMLSQGLDGAPAVVLLTPVVLGVAEQMGANPRTFMMGVSLAASAAFMTPFSHKANLLVMGVGGYRVADYVRVGSGLTIAVLLMIIVLTPLLFPF